MHLVHTVHLLKEILVSEFVLCVGYIQGGHQFNLRHRLNCSMDVTVQCMALARSHGSFVDLLSTRGAIELN
jgi:hypothetical protein